MAGLRERRARCKEVQKASMASREAKGYLMNVSLRWGSQTKTGGWLRQHRGEQLDDGWGALVASVTR